MDNELLQALNKLNVDIKTIKNSQLRIENRLDAVAAQAADQIEFRTTTVNKLITINSDVNKIRNDISTSNKVNEIQN